ncbi:hypothetical protein GCM10011512_24860 [Tersicoccus solisilvae]|uniref:Restriction endonuclease type IV Mrr domain-containing protein n=1 Tax=Tersicoccus solisilvae TaxID=1882339 RepID=A0ABQ1PGJ3_9MICC|nr:hypothetical protein [Tersicoccus solisilvae]GGC96868.1 hypothetical protein GCM10011512_24860 [Tersicoccus solisilvae]
MLRDVVGTFLDTLTEREFDGPLLALLHTRGFTDIHFIHGAFEFGKDVLAKKVDPATGETRQYVLQSKAGDIGQPEWRAVRPQLEECEYNTIGHPSFDPDLPRVAVLVTTGRLKGAAPADVTEYRKSVDTRGLADLEIWERPDLVEWLCDDPFIGVAGEVVQTELLAMLTSVMDGGLTDGRIETYSRRWLRTAGTAPRASVEAAILINSLLRTQRLDLALCVGLQLIRATAQDPAASEDARSAAKRLVLRLTLQVCDQTEPSLKDPLDFIRSTVGQLAFLTYPVICCRVAEALAIGLALAREAKDGAAATRFDEALRAFAEQPGAAHPVGDLFAPSVVAVTVMLATSDHAAAKAYLSRVARWVLDRYDEDLAGLGLASLAEDEERTAERLLGGSLASTTLDRRTSSYLMTVVLDLALHLGEMDLYEAVRDNVSALRVVPHATSADETKARWARGGTDVWPLPRVEFESWDVQIARPAQNSPTSPVLSLLLAAGCRSRHYPGGWGGLPSD